MKLIPCPLNGLRPENEFIYGGIVRAIPPAHADDSAWRDYLFFDDNVAGEVWEWWFHLPSSFWFAARRNTTTDCILATLSVAAADTDAAILNSADSTAKTVAENEQ